MKNLKVVFKLILGFALVLILFFFSIGYTVMQLGELSDEMTLLSEGPFVVNDAANSMKSNVEGAFKYTMYALAEENPETIDSAVASAERNVGEFEDDFERVVAANKAVAQLGGDASRLQGKIDAVASANKALAPHLTHLLDLADNNETAAALVYYETTAADYMTALNKAVDDIVAEAGDMADDTVIAYEKLEIDIQRSLWVTLGICTLLVVIVCYVIARSFNRPIKEIEAAAKEMTKGNLKAELKYTAKDELGSLAESMRFVMKTLSGYVDNIDFTLSEVANGNLTVSADMEYLGDFAQIRVSLNRILDSLNETLGGINQASEQVASGSEQVSSGAQSLASGSTEQAASIQQLSASINEVQVQAEQNNQIASDTLTETEQAGELMSASMSYMNEMTAAMHEINESSHNIAKVIKVIEDIAFQTNILALNAAVEAARAGSAGKGFAVVADEVRNLASKSAEAAKETAALIESSVASVSMGNEIAIKTGESLVGVSKIAQANAEGMQKLSEASQQQMLSISEITTGIEQISAVIQANSATAEQSAAASEELSSQANMLKNLVARFQVKGYTAEYSVSAPMLSMAALEESVYADKYDM